MVAAELGVHQMCMEATAATRYSITLPQLEAEGRLAVRLLTEEAVGLAVLGHMVAREALVHQGKALQVAARSVALITTTVAVAAQAR